MNAPFLSNEHGDAAFFQVFAKNSLIKNIFEEGKSLIVEHECFLESVLRPIFFFFLLHYFNAHIMNILCQDSKKVWK